MAQSVVVEHWLLYEAGIQKSISRIHVTMAVILDLNTEPPLEKQKAWIQQFDTV